MSKKEQKEVMDLIGRLDDDQKNRLLEYANNMLKAGQNRKKLLDLAGSISKSDLKLMKEAIRENKKVDKDGW